MYDDYLHDPKHQAYSIYTVYPSNGKIAKIMKHSIMVASNSSLINVEN